MPRGYRHIQEYEKEILELKAQGVSKREIGERFGFSYEQVHNFISRRMYVRTVRICDGTPKQRYPGGGNMQDIQESVYCHDCGAEEIPNAHCTQCYSYLLSIY